MTKEDDKKDRNQAFYDAIKANHLHRPHRCVLRMQDFIHSFSQFSMKNTWHTWKVFCKCMVSQVGNEPRDPILFLPPEIIEDFEAAERRGHVRNAMFDRTSTADLVKQLKAIDEETQRKTRKLTKVESKDDESF